MNYLEKLYYNMDKLSDKYGDMEETKEAQDTMEKAIGAEVCEKAEDEICRCMSANEKQGFIHGFQYAVSLLTNGNSNAGNLEELMRNEYDAISFMDTPMPKDREKAMSIIHSKFTQKEFLKVEEMLTGSYVEAEKFGFEQGFMRGIAVAKGGAI